MIRLPAIVLVVVASVFAVQLVDAADIEHLNSEAAKAQGLPFSEAVRVGDTIYLSGRIGTKPGTAELVAGGVEAEAEQALRHIQATLERFDSDLEHVAKCTVFLVDIADWAAVNVVYKRFFRPPYPARSAVAGSGLALGAKVEIECIAIAK
jgi:reactive intermediate/imine deaminase